MSVQFNEVDASAKIKVVGVGGCGGNIVKYLLPRNAPGIDYMAVNTDLKALNQQDAQVECLHIGREITHGLGAGAKPEVAAEAALSEEARLREMMHGYDMVFVTAGMGKGTGTGASPVVARIARELEILVVAVITRPFAFENRGAAADKGILELSQHADSLIVVPNEKLIEVLGEESTQKEALEAANGVLYNAVYGVSEIINNVGEMNIDFNDVRSVMSVQGKSVIGSAVAAGDDRAQQAVFGALHSPLMENIALDTAEHVLVNVTAHADKLKMKEFALINDMISEHIPNCRSARFNGLAYDDAMGEQVRVTVIVTGLRDDLSFEQQNIADVRQVAQDSSIVSGRKRHKAQQLIDKFGGSEKDIPTVLRQQIS